MEPQRNKRNKTETKNNKQLVSPNINSTLSSSKIKAGIKPQILLEARKSKSSKINALLAVLDSQEGEEKDVKTTYSPEEKGRIICLCSESM